MTRASFRRILDRLQSSYWFIPLVMAILGFLLARLMYQVDLRIPGTRLSTQEFIYSGSAEAARTILLGLAGSILATAGVVYSLLTVPFSLVASQYGSRLLRLLLRDTTIQLVLGLFVGTFTYLLTVALAIPPATAEPAPPHLSVSVGLYLSLACFGSLILLIHHIGVSLQAPHMAAGANEELQAVLKEVIPISKRQFVRQPDEADVLIAGRIEREGDPIYAETQGYIQALDTELIRPLARKNNLVVRLVRKPGNFVQRGELVAIVWPPRNIGTRIMENIRDSYQVGRSRTPTQDLEYGFNQLVEMAVRAMSPAINDPFTAMTCLDYIGAGLSVYAAEFEPITNVYDDSGHLRLIVDPQSFAQVLDAALNMIRQASRDNPEVLLHMLDSLEQVGKKCAYPEQRAEILRHVNLVRDENQAGSAVRGDKERVDRRCAELAAVLAGPMA